MGRWQPDGRGRLQEAALALYTEHGYDQTTTAQIAARAGLSERTFFRHFADKREVLFGGSGHLGERIVAAVAGAPAGSSPLDAVAAGLDAAARMLGEFRRDLTRQRQAVIDATPELRERELAKLDDYAAAVRAALSERGVDQLQATLAAEAGMSILRVAMQQWAADGEARDLATIVRDCVTQLRSLLTTGRATRTTSPTRHASGARPPRDRSGSRAAKGA
jgi:AcrR family transcriptional regulator